MTSNPARLTLRIGVNFCTVVAKFWDFSLYVDGQNMGQLLVTNEKISTEHIEVEDRSCYVLLEIFQ